MGKINYNLKNMSRVGFRGINTSDIINEFIVDSDNTTLRVSGSSKLSETINDIKNINGTFLFSVDKYVENADHIYSLFINNIYYVANFKNYYLDVDNVYIAVYIGNETFTIYKLDSDEEDIIGAIASLTNRVTALENSSIGFRIFGGK